VDGTMWFGTFAGLSHYDGKFTNFNIDDGLAGRNVSAIHQDPDGVLWFGTNGGVSRYDGETFINFTTSEGLVHNRINAIYRVPDGDLWFGTGGGVSRYDGVTFVNFVRGSSAHPKGTTAYGLAHDDVNAIYRDVDGLMWFGADNGVSLYDGEEWSSLDTRDGLTGNAVSAILPDADESLWFATDGGLTRYRRGKNAPTVHITKVSIDKDYTNLSSIPPLTTRTRVTITYRAMDFRTVPEKQRYRIRIRERHKDWLDATHATTFNHTFDETGIYTVEVQAIDRDLNYSLPASLTLKIVPPFYLRASFLVPTIGVGTLALVMLVIQAIVLLKRRRQIHAYQQLAVAELQDARRVQMGLMPEVAPEIEGLEVAGRCVSANTVSGDFFDYLQGDNEKEIAIVVGDVTGHGMQGAMNATLTDGVLQMAAEEMEQISPATLMMKVNNVLKPRMESGMNVTMVIGLINADTKTLTLANAGHHAHPLLLRNGMVEQLVSKGMPLGMMAGISY